MKNYRRTTITIPENIYRKVKTKAALENKSMSGFITGVLEKTTGIKRKEKVHLPFGKYDLGGKKLGRRNIYEHYLKRKVSR